MDVVSKILNNQQNILLSMEETPTKFCWTSQQEGTPSGTFGGGEVTFSSPIVAVPSFSKKKYLVDGIIYWPPT